MRPTCASRDGLAFLASVLFLVVGFLWALGCAAIGPQCELTVIPGPGGTVDPPGGTFRCGTEITLTVHPYPSWAFTHWSGDLTGNDNPATLLMDGDKTVTANWF
jgi:hypothetical protein